MKRITTLRNLIIGGKLTVENKADIISSMISMAVSGSYLGLISPDTILIDENMNIVNGTPDAWKVPSDNLVYASPILQKGAYVNMSSKLITLQNEGVPKAGAYTMESIKHSQFFSIGMVIYFMFYNKDFYENANILILDSEQKLQKRSAAGGSNSLITALDIPGLIYRDAVVSFTAFNPIEREKGITDFNKALMKAGYICYVDVHYMFQGREIYLGNSQISPGMALFLLRQRVRGIDGNMYEVVTSARYQYRPGKHHFVVEVKAL